MAGCVDQQTFDQKDWRGVSVMMMQNLPCRCTPEEIGSAVGELGFAHHVNYFHLPRKLPGGRNLGYAFIGLVTPELAQKFRDAFEGYTFTSRSSSKKVRLKPAHRQPVSSPDRLRPNAPARQKQASLPSLQVNMPAHQQQASLRNRRLVNILAHEQQASLPSRPMASAPPHQQQAFVPNCPQAITAAHQQWASSPNQLQAETPARQQQASLPNQLQASARAHQWQPGSLPNCLQANMAAHRQHASLPNHLQAGILAHRQAFLPRRLHASVSFSEQEETDLMVAALQHEAILLKKQIDLMIAALKRDQTMQTRCNSPMALSEFSHPPGVGKNQAYSVTWEGDRCGS
eukprot:TRINITY_DN4784_c0_g4_i1.p1 TRINITY_DN4784_c0_g4~~TRINITY_DN4784_c0_g4_i1.p1  ORF type:complete len:371 (+),score=77.86 TRINITY_DN4784_c0_g4_i1:79-1113(+)